MTRLLSSLALIGLVSVGPALANDGSTAQVFERGPVLAQLDAGFAAATTGNHPAVVIDFDRADRSITSTR